MSQALLGDDLESEELFRVAVEREEDLASHTAALSEKPDDLEVLDGENARNLGGSEYRFLVCDESLLGCRVAGDERSGRDWSLDVQKSAADGRDHVELYWALAGHI